MSVASASWSSTGEPRSVRFFSAVTSPTRAGGHTTHASRTHGGQAGPRHRVPGATRAVARVLERDPAHPGPGEHLQHEAEALGETRTDDDVRGVRGRGPDPGGVAGDHLPQHRAPARVAVAEG